MTVFGVKIPPRARAPAVVALCVLSAALGGAPAAADDRLNHCIADICMDLFRRSGQERTDITLRPSMTHGTHMNISYVKSVLLGQQQFEVPFSGAGARLQVYVKKGGLYHFSAQICRSGGFLQRSRCEPWRTFAYRVKTL